MNTAAFAHAFSEWADRAHGVLTSEAFWAAAAAIATIGGLLLVSRQIAMARNVHAYEFLRKEADRFSAPEMRADRSALARDLLVRPSDFAAIELNADWVLDFFEDLGLMVRAGIAPSYLTWTMFCYDALRYWKALAPYVAWVRRVSGDATFYSEFEHLYERMLVQERKVRGTRDLEPDAAEVRSFLVEELHVTYRRVDQGDFQRVLTIERLSFPPGDAYDLDEFNKLYRDRSELFWVAEACRQVVGYGVASVDKTTAEIDSVAIDQRFRRVRIGRALTLVLIEELRAEGIAHCQLHVAAGNQAAIALYRGLGFSHIGEEPDYYADGSPALVFELDLSTTADSGHEPEGGN